MMVRIVREVVAALCVCALVGLSFAHAPSGPTPATGAILTAGISTGFCGDIDDERASHEPCQACRIGGSADLPPACGGVILAPEVAVEAKFEGRRTASVVPLGTMGLAGPRAPPGA